MFVRCDDKTSSWWLPSKWENWNPPSAADPGDGMPSFFGPNLSKYSALLSCTMKYRLQRCAYAVYTVQCSAMLYYAVLMLCHGWLFPLLLIQCCASWVTNFTSPYLAWHSIYLSKWKLIYLFLSNLVVLSDFRGLCDPCFGHNFVFEIVSVKEMLNRTPSAIFGTPLGP